MKSVLKVSLAAAIAVSSISAAAPAFAGQRHHESHEYGACMNHDAVLPVLFVGAALGAVTGGVGSAVVWGAAYAVGGAAVGGGAGLLLTTAHAHHHCE